MMERARVKASACDVGHRREMTGLQTRSRRWEGCKEGLGGSRRQARQGPGGAGALDDCWPSRVWWTPASRVRCAGLRPLLTPAQPPHLLVGRRPVRRLQKMGVVQGLWLERVGEQVYDRGRVRGA